MQENEYEKRACVQKPKKLICQITIDSPGMVVDSPSAKCTVNPSREQLSKQQSKLMSIAGWTNMQIRLEFRIKRVSKQIEL